jgi:ankyrin repeat protein
MRAKMTELQTMLEWIKGQANQELKEALATNPAIAQMPTGMGISLLTFAAYCRNEEAVVAIRSHVGEISFFEAVAIGELDAVQWQLSAESALLNSFSDDGFTALGLASFFGHQQLVQYLLQAGADPNIAANNAIGVYPIHSACAVSNYAIAEILLENGANPNVKQQKDITPLHSAAHNGQLELARLLLKHGAALKALTSDGQTPAAMAEEAGFMEVYQLLN